MSYINGATCVLVIRVLYLAVNMMFFYNNNYYTSIGAYFLNKSSIGVQPDTHRGIQ